MGTIWYCLEMLRPAYGLVESGRLWQLAIESWLADYGFTKIPGLSQMFILRTTTGRIKLLLAKVVDDLLLDGSINPMNKFHSDLSSRFKVGRFICNRPFTFKALKFSQDTTDFSHTMDMRDYQSKCLNVTLSPENRKEVYLPASPAERTALKQLADTLNFLGHAVRPPACYVASFLQQQLDHLRVCHLLQANTLLKALLNLEPILHFTCSPVTPRGIRILV
jgi:Reverse transcriptase (RNA-dependent DNA polymerase)